MTTTMTATAFLGPRGTFSEEAALGYVARRAEPVGTGDETPRLLPFSSIPALTAAVETGLATEALLPIENSIEGSVSTTLDLLIHETALRIVAEVVLPVRHFLVTAPGVGLEDIRVVTSHPNALGQCRRFLERCLPDAAQVAALSTAAAVQAAVAATGTGTAGIGTARAAELYGGAVLAHDIQDTLANLTRFIALARHDAAPTGDDKTSLGFTVKANVPGALYGIMSELATGDIQMTKVESRPTKGGLGDYVFLVDIEGHREDDTVARALDRLRDRTARLWVFGSYPRFPIETLAGQVESVGGSR